jgi:hypothetical protein
MGLSFEPKHSVGSFSHSVLAAVFYFSIWVLAATLWQAREMMHACAYLPMNSVGECLWEIMRHGTKFFFEVMGSIHSKDCESTIFRK